jgi:phosphatidylethanolamine/phosphatidyl-N-methylethanolamine N-methyltransferase
MDTLEASNRNGAGVTRNFGENLLFLRRFLRHPMSVGAVLPSSRYLAGRMVEELGLVPGNRVVEFGPGTGALTAAIAPLIPAGGRFLGIERDPVFVAALRKRWPGLDWTCDSVENLVPIVERFDLMPLDAIISGLPFASLPRDVTLPILDGAYKALRHGGTFSTFQYVHAYGFPTARDFRREMAVRFGPPFARRLVIRNFPPAFVLSWRKGNGGGSS